MNIEGKLDAGGALASSPAIADHFAFVSTLGGEILQIDINAGEITRRYKINEPMRLQPLLYRGYILAVTMTGKLVAINTKNKSIAGWHAWGKNSARTTM